MKTRNILRNDAGVSAIEYGALLCCVAVALAIALPSLQASLTQPFTAAGNAMPGGTSPARTPPNKNLPAISTLP